MPRAHIVREVCVQRTPRVMQMEGIFDVPPTERSWEEWHVEIPIEERDWNVGLIVGPSGCGKSTIARELFGDALVTGYEWPTERSVLDGFPEEMPIKSITGLLSSVGFSSPPAWLRPFHVLSTGQQFRVTVARAMADPRPVVVVDEFTSVVDRTVAQIGSAAVAKSVRSASRRLVAVSCHYDIVDWLQPDWIYEPANGVFAWRSLQCRPPLCFTVRMVRADTWELFKKYHYLSADHHPGAKCFAFFMGEEPVAFISVIHYPGAHPCWRAHRAVVLPDYGGAGIGSRLAETVAPWFAATGKPFLAITAHPALIRHHAKSPLWDMTRAPAPVKARNNDGGIRSSRGYERMGDRMATNRLTATFRYSGPADPDTARELGLLLSQAERQERTLDWQRRASLAARQRERRLAKGKAR